LNDPPCPQCRAELLDERRIVPRIGNEDLDAPLRRKAGGLGAGITYSLLPRRREKFIVIVCCCVVASSVKKEETRARAWLCHRGPVGLRTRRRIPRHYGPSGKFSFIENTSGSGPRSRKHAMEMDQSLPLANCSSVTTNWSDRGDAPSSRAK
jgi:hypothetical protein